jgi:hypothetical protein
MARASVALRGRFGHLAAPRRSQRVALRAERPDTAGTAESARRSSFAVRADEDMAFGGDGEAVDKQPDQRRCGIAAGSAA